MKTILDLGKAGAEHMDVSAPQPDISIAGVGQFLPFIERYPTLLKTFEIDSGVKADTEVHALMLHNRQTFDLLWLMAPYEPLVYASQGGRGVMGILSPNFDSAGAERLPSLKVLTLRTPYPLLQKGNDLLPDARMANMLAGSAHAEGAGSGSHAVLPEHDYEHKQTFLGAISLGNTTISSGGRHVQHAERGSSSVAAGLTNGRLGNLYAPDGERTADFSGYGLPLLFNPSDVQPTDAIYIPKSFLQAETAYGVHYDDAARIAYGAGLQILHQRQGIEAVNMQMRRIAEAG